MNRATKLRRLERATSPTQSLRAKRARHYGGVGYFANEREIVQKFPLGSKVRVRYGKTTGRPLYDERVWTVSSHGLEGPTPWRSYTDSVKSLLGTSLAILKVSRVGARRNPMVRDNPHRYSLRGRVITFDNGNSYHINEATVRQAAHYLAHTVKIAEHEGRRVPKGPHGLTPGAAAVLIHFGRKLLRKKRRAAPKRKPAAKRVVRRAVPKRRPVAKRPVRRAAPAPRTAPAPARRPAAVDFWDRTAEIYGGLR